MDIRLRRSEAKRLGGVPGTTATLAPSSTQQGFSPQRIGQILGEWQSHELRVARGFTECRGLSTEQLEDIYQETALALYSRSYDSEEHLRNALRTGLKHRALNMHRDERRRGQILARSAPGLRLMAQASEVQSAPEPAALAHEDRLIISEFLTELNPVEQRVFWLLSENMQYRAIATALGIPVNQARNTARSCARKREHFQLLYDTGRLCGYRARTIQALQNGEVTSEELAERAFAHLDELRALPRRAQDERQPAAAQLPRPGRGTAATCVRRPSRLAGEARRASEDAPVPPRGGWLVARAGRSARTRRCTAGGRWHRRQGRRRSLDRRGDRGRRSRHACARPSAGASPPPHHTQRSRDTQRDIGSGEAGRSVARAVAGRERPPNRAYPLAPPPPLAPFQPRQCALRLPRDEQAERCRAARTGRLRLPRGAHGDERSRERP